MRRAASHRYLLLATVSIAFTLCVHHVRSEEQPETVAPIKRGVDLYGDPLPHGAIARLGTVRYRNPGWYKRVKFVPNTATFVVGAPGGVLRFHDAPNGKLVKEIVFGEAYLQAFDVSADGKTVATLSSLRLGETREFNTQLELWDARSGESKRVIQWIEPLAEQSVRMALTLDGTIIATGTRNGNLRFWDVASGDELLSASVVDRGEVEAIAFSPDGEQVAVASRGGVYVWEWSTENEAQELAGLERGAMSVTFSPDGRWLAVGSDDGTGCRLFDAASMQLMNRLKGRAASYYVEGLAFNAAGQLLAVPARDAGVEVWDVAGGKLVKTFASGRIAVRDAAISSDGQYLVGVGSETAVPVWNFATGDEIGGHLVGHNEAPYEVEFTPDGAAVVTGDLSGVIHMWDADSGKPLSTMGHERWVAALAVSPDGKYIVSAGHDDSIRVWNATTGEQVYKLYGHGRLGGKYKLAFAPDSRTFASFGPDMFLRTWDLRTGKCLTEHAIRPQGMMIEEDEEGNVQPDRDPFGGGLMEASGSSLFSADAGLLLLPNGGDLHVFDVQSGRELRKFAPGGAAFQRFAISPDRKWLVTLATGRGRQGPSQATELRVIDFATNETRVHRELDGRYLREIQFSPDGSLWAMSGYGDGAEDRWISIWSMTPPEEVARIPGGATAVAFSPDNARLAASDSDTSVLVWDLAAFRIAED